MLRATSYLFIGGAVGVAAIVGGTLTPAAVKATGTPGLGLYKQALEIALEKDVWSDNPDLDKVTKSAIDTMLASLDPHSNYFDAKQYNDFQTQMKGENFGGLGIEVVQESGLIRVVTPIDETPAARAGLQSGDMIVKIDDTQVKGLTLKEAVDRMRGVPKTSVRLTIRASPARRGGCAQAQSATVPAKARRPLSSDGSPNDRYHPILHPDYCSKR